MTLAAIASLDACSLKDFVEGMSAVATTLGTIAAGIWAGFRFFSRWRAKVQLNTTLDGELLELSGRRYLRASAAVTNAGLTRVNIDRRKSQMSVWSIALAPDAQKDAFELKPQLLVTFQVLNQHEIVEPGETLREERLIALPSGEAPAALQLASRVAAHGLSFTTTAIVPYAERSAEQTQRTLAASRGIDAN